MRAAHNQPATNYTARPAQFDRASQHRRSMIAKIQIARKDLAMDEDDYRQIVFDKTGRTSLKEASERDLHDVLEVMKAKGFRPLAKIGQVAAAQHPVAKKARALWISLYQLGVVHNPSEQALEAFGCKMLKCDKLVWANQRDGYKLIEALKDMAKRNGWPQQDLARQKPLSPIGLQSALCQAILGKLKDGGQVPADWGLHDAMWKLCGEENARERAWTTEDYQRLAAQLGAKLRELGGSQ